jgi:hypothetical protein
LFNEIDIAMFDILPAAYQWHIKAAELIRQYDIYHHLISESYGLPIGNIPLDENN